MMNPTAPIFHLHVSPDGDDSAPGDLNAPLASFQGARNRLRNLRETGQLPEPCEVVFHDGRYEITEPVVFSPEDSGRITFKAQTPGNAIVDGSEVVRGWETCVVNGVQAWRTHLPGFHAARRTCRQLWSNGQPRPRARYPKFDLSTEAGRRNVFRVAEQRPMADHNPLTHNDFLFKPDPTDGIQAWASL